MSSIDQKLLELQRLAFECHIKVQKIERTDNNLEIAKRWHKISPDNFSEKQVCKYRLFLLDAIEDISLRNMRREVFKKIEEIKDLALEDSDPATMWAVETEISHITRYETVLERYENV